MIIQEMDSTRVVIDAPAKINLYLEVLGKRPDGFHEISSLFQAVSLFDRLEFSRLNQPGLSLTIEGAPGLTAGEDNIVGRAYNLLRRRFELAGGMKVELAKRIPIAAGLGGGPVMERRRLWLVMSCSNWVYSQPKWLKLGLR